MMPNGTFRGGPVLGRGMFMPEFTSGLSDPETSQGGHFNVHYTVGAGGMVIEVDKETGKVTVLKVCEAFDCGKALNPELVRHQIIGGFMQGLATALYEDMRFDAKGRILNPNFTDYKIPTALEMPKEIIPIIVEEPQHDGPYGARGVGEHTMIPVCPAMANALEDALGIRFKTLPFTAEKIAMAIKEGKKEV
jgi:CO/xanthine dehydrogenase Mo-binding subunit